MRTRRKARGRIQGSWPWSSLLSSCLRVASAFGAAASHFQAQAEHLFQAPVAAEEREERHDFPPSLVEDIAAHNEHPSAKILRQLYFGPKTTIVRSQDR